MANKLQYNLFHQQLDSISILNNSSKKMGNNHKLLPPNLFRICFIYSSQSLIVDYILLVVDLNNQCTCKFKASISFNINH